MILVNFYAKYEKTAFGNPLQISNNLKALVLNSLTQLILKSSACLLIPSKKVVKYSGIFSVPTRNFKFSPVYNLGHKSLLYFSIEATDSLNLRYAYVTFLKPIAPRYSNSSSFLFSSTAPVSLGYNSIPG